MNEYYNTGLSDTEIQYRLQKFGPNKIEVAKKNTVLKMLISQFTSIIIIILFICAIIFLLIGDTLEFALVLAIIVINGFIGFAQEYKADKAVESLKKMLVLKAEVLRDGQRKEINSEELVPDDVVFVYEGDKVPADLKLIENYSLLVDESILTGESTAVRKDLKESNILFSGTTIVSGKGKAIVINTGMKTEFGKIVNLISEEKPVKTNLEKEVDHLSKVLIYIMITSFAVLFVLGLIRGQPVLEIFLVAVSLGIAAIPEGLPIVMTLTLATGVQLMSKKNAIVKKLNSVEALGSTTVICSDKTGTLTLNEMTVVKLGTLSYEKDISPTGYSYAKKEVIDNRDAQKLIDIANNCNNAIIDKGLSGDPTEIALKVLSKKAMLDNSYKFLDEIPFSSQRKMMSTIHDISGHYEMFSKGAPGEILKRSTKILEHGKVRAITRKDIDYFEKLEEKYALQALRVLAFAYKPMENLKDKKEGDLVFVGIVGMMDPPRADVKDALLVAKKAGIRTKIITGDNPLTAMAVAEKIGMKNPVVVRAEILDALTDKEATELIYKTDIFARARPEHKYRIVSLFQNSGEIVAVTGDGVNDAPALKKADIGIAMGIKGTEASKEVADIVLNDDNYSTIVSAISEGRKIYDNILMFIRYMLAVNFDLLFMFTIFLLLRYPIPLLALQILWVNLITDSLPAIALGQKPASKSIMERHPTDSKKQTRKYFTIFIIVALIIKIFGEILLFSYGLNIDATLGINTFDISQNSYARTLLVTSIVVFELLFAFACNSDGSLRLKKIFSNKFLTYSVLIVFALQLFFIYSPFMQIAFHTAPLALIDWVYVFVFALSSFLVIPLVNKLALNKKKTSNNS